jgi:hypothetical protein
MAQGASSSGILAGGYGGLGASVSPTTAGNVLFTADGSVWSSTQKIVRGTSVATTSGTSIDFTSIPSWVKRVTIMLNGVSTSGTSAVILQIGSSSFTTSGYLGTGTGYASGSTGNSVAFTNGFSTEDSGIANLLRYGRSTLFNISGNIWIFSSVISTGGTAGSRWGGGSLTLSGVLDRVRLTTFNGTDTFDAGSVNILYE